MLWLGRSIWYLSLFDESNLTKKCNFICHRYSFFLLFILQADVIGRFWEREIPKIAKLSSFFARGEGKQTYKQTKRGIDLQNESQHTGKTTRMWKSILVHRAAGFNCTTLICYFVHPKCWKADGLTLKKQSNLAKWFKSEIEQNHAIEKVVLTWFIWLIVTNTETYKMRR